MNANIRKGQPGPIAIGRRAAIEAGLIIGHCWRSTATGIGLPDALSAALHNDKNHPEQSDQARNSIWLRLACARCLLQNPRIMRIDSHWLRLPVFVAFTLLLALASEAVLATSTKRVLIIHSFGRDFEPYGTTGSVFRTELVSGSPDTVRLYEATFDAGRKASTREEQTFIDYLIARFDGNAPDLVVTIGPPAARFYLAHRNRIFPDAPYMMAALDERLARGAPLRPGDAAIVGKVDLPRLFEDFLRAVPDTKTVAMVFGASDLERYWVAAAREVLAKFEGRIEFLWLNDLSLEQINHRVAKLPPQSAVFLGLMITDAAGIPHDRAEVLAQLHKAANAPIFGLYETDLGKGSVGGPYSSQRRHGEQMATAALRILNGTASDTTQFEITGFSPPVYDWRELDRWKIHSEHLPPGSEIRFKPPSFWEEHRTAVVATFAALLIQTALIGSLLLQRMGRRRAEREAHSLGGRLITAHEDERRRLARELHDDVTQRLAVLAIEAAKIETSGDPANRLALGAVRDGLVDLSEDVHALSYQLHPSIIEDLGLVEALKAECDRVAHQETIDVALDFGSLHAKLPSDAAICLFRVAQEALRNVVRHAGASTVNVSLHADDAGLTLCVRDNGAGFDDSGKRDRASLGLASMRERVRLQGGRIDIESTPGRGTAVIAWIPLQKAT